MASLAGSLLAVILVQSAPEPQAPPIPIAVLQSGQRVECVEAEAGDREFQTPYGLFRSPTNPVEKVVDGAQQAKDLRKLRSAGVLDDFTWLHDLSTAGQLRELSMACLEVLAQDHQNTYPYELLESWGRKLDPVPAKLDRDKRISWLWKRVTGKDFTLAVLAGAKLREEVSQSSQAQNERVVSIRQLRSAIRSKSIVQRRVACLVAGQQREFTMRELLLETSIADKLDPVRCAAAEGTHQIHAHSARQYWVRNLAQGSGAHRDAAAWNLGHFGGADALNALIHVLAAWEHKPPERFRFADRTIWVVHRSDRSAGDLGGYNPEKLEVDFRHLSPDLEFLDLGSTFTVTRYGESLHILILEALDTWAGEKTDRDTAAWITWYLEVWLPSRA
jgi:hypothetical protein